MERLKEKEWLLVNDIIRDIYAAEDINQMQRVFLLSIRKLIPYKSAVFCMVTPEFRLDLDHSVIVGADTRSLERYNDRYIEEDFTNGIFDFPKSTSYKDEDLIDPEEKKQTRFYREWLLGNDCKYSGGAGAEEGSTDGQRQHLSE